MNRMQTFFRRYRADTFAFGFLALAVLSGAIMVTLILAAGSYGPTVDESIRRAMFWPLWFALASVVCRFVSAAKAQA